eukprot:9778832-Heterocapsa_arctica.AAC.1
MGNDPTYQNPYGRAARSSAIISCKPPSTSPQTGSHAPTLFRPVAISSLSRLLVPVQAELTRLRGALGTLRTHAQHDLG